MTGVILHQYPTSPYGEMVRVALGMKGLAWSRVELVLRYWFGSAFILRPVGRLLPWLPT